MKLFGTEWTRRELLARGGRLEQFAGCTRYELQDGAERGVEIIEVRTGSGLRFGVCPSRGLDIVWAEHNGRPLSWNSSTGIAHPHTYNENNLGWLRGFAGGLLTTCGLQSFGPPCEDDGEQFGIHDRISYLPASNVSTQSVWRDESTLELVVSGAVRQTRVFGPNLLLQRTITARGGENTLTVRDRITNEGFAPAGCVVLYHCNFGFPVVSEHSTVRGDFAHSRPRDADAAAGFDRRQQMEVPQADFAEQVFFHDMAPDESGYVRAEIWNPQLMLVGFVRYRFAELPYFAQWKMMGAGTYVCGLEPSNAPLATRTELKANNALPVLQPGERFETEIQLGVIE
jgi:hypothetical protein